MKLGETLYVADRKAWRAWLSKNHGKKREVWLVYPRKHAGKPRISYADAVEEALCFGWIDSTVKRIDGDSYAQRFTPRKNTGNWSQPNVERMRRLIKLGEMTPAGLAAFKNPELLAKKQKLKIAPDVIRALKRNPRVWKNFQRFPGGYKRIRIAYIEDRRRYGADAFEKSLRNFVKKTRENKRFAFGGVQ
ncbi:Bacteriocin-protection, YdeI or OmpD-Associated [Candidatus Norongarragalina meridionalis]|nr:Bacteriocin-protection, YdeI or OmpD-Associated [Candidatus Norongarragalina meridionalis]